MRFFTHRNSWRDTVAITAVTLALLGLATAIDNDVLAFTIAVVAIAGMAVAFRVTRKPIDRQDRL